jgi:hypothetical protein
VRCYFVRDKKIEGVTFLRVSPVDNLITQAQEAFQRHAAHNFEGFEVWDGDRFVYRWPPDGQAAAETATSSTCDLGMGARADAGAPGPRRNASRVRDVMRSITATLAAFLALTISSHATPRDEDQFHDAWQAMTVQLEKDVKASNPDVVEIRLAGNTLILGTIEPLRTENDWQAMATARDKADAWPQYAEAACDSSQLRRYMGKGFSVVFRLYDTTGNLRVTYAPVNIAACRQ